MADELGVDWEGIMRGVDLVAEMLKAVKARLVEQGFSEANAERVAVSIWEQRGEQGRKA